MSCLKPLEAYRDRHGLVKIGRGGSFAVEDFYVSCGRCTGCKMDRARSWAIRISHEASLYDVSRFATFTYSDKYVPASGSLEYGDFQRFMKRLRKRLKGASPGPEGNYPLRFFCAGEYGSKRKRPHFHAIMFNLRMPDERLYENGSYHSELLESLWMKGTVRLDPVNARTAAYVAGYSLKKVYGSRARNHYDVVSLETGEVVQERRAEFVAMSLKPGIGAWWYRRFRADMFPGDFAVMDGKKWKTPRYYWEKFKGDGDPLVVEELAYERYLRAQFRREDETPERRAVRLEVLEAKLNVTPRMDL